MYIYYIYEESLSRNYISSFRLNTLILTLIVTVSRLFITYLAPFLIKSFKEEARFVTLERPPKQMMIPVMMALLPPIYSKGT